MELISQYIIHITVFMAFVLTALSIICRRRSTAITRINLPPGKKGWPLLGETLDYFMAGKNGEPEKFVNERTLRYSSDVFKTSLLGQDVVVFCGDSGNKFLLSSGNRNFKQWVPKAIERAMHLNEGESIKFQSVMLEFLKSSVLQRYVPIMDSMAKEHLETNWLPYKQVKAHQLLKKFTFSLSCRLFMDIKDPNEVTGLQHLLAAIVNGFFCVPINFPGTTYRLSLRAAKIIREKLVLIINTRKLELSKFSSSYHDILSHMLSMSSPMSEDAILSGIILMLFASHDTITSAITFTIKYLAENPQVYEQVLKEQREIAKLKGPKEMLNLSDIEKMPYSWCVARESMRLTPPALGTFREAINDITYEGFTIPKGWKGYWTVHSTHKNPNYFKEPAKFDPSRFQGEGPAPYTYLPFAMGPHMCKGKEYARLAILVFMHNLVTKFHLHIVIEDEKTIYKALVSPANGLPIRIESHVS